MSQNAGTPMAQYELTIPMLPDAELVAARATEEIARLIRFPTRAIEQVRMAVIEACLNAIEHSQSTDQRVHLHFSSDEETLRVVVRDFGKGFDPASVKPPDIRGRIGARQKGGWGIFLIGKLMDEVVFEPVPNGTCLRMTKLRAAPVERECRPEPASPVPSSG